MAGSNSIRSDAMPSANANPAAQVNFIFRGTSKNRPYSSDATKLPANDSVSFVFRFINVHSEAVSDRQRKQFFEVPLGSCLTTFSMRLVRSVEVRIIKKPKRREYRTKVWPQPLAATPSRWVKTP